MSRRTDRVNELLRREVSQVVQRDYEWRGALVTIGAVEVTPDLKEAKVHVGVIGGNEGAVLERLNKEHGSIQSRVMQRVAQAGWVLANLDTTLVAQAPKIAPHIDTMRDNLAADLSTELSQVNVKATTTEKLGFTGREEGIAAHAVVLLQAGP